MIALAIGILLVIDMPKYYTSETTMAPETENDLPKSEMSQTLLAQRTAIVETERITAGHTVEVEVFICHYFLLSC